MTNHTPDVPSGPSFEPVSQNDFDRALERLNVESGREFTYSPAIAYSMIAQQMMRLGGRHFAIEVLRVDLSVTVLLSCMNPAMLEASMFVRQRFAMLVLEEWLWKQGTPLVFGRWAHLEVAGIIRRFTFRAAGRLDDKLISHLAKWLDGVVVKTAGVPLAQQPDTTARVLPRDFRVFVACAITGVDGYERDALVAAVDEVAQELARIDLNANSGISVSVHSAILYRNPKSSRYRSGAPDNRVDDEIEIMNSDVVLILPSPSAAGLGAVSEIASRYEIPRIIFGRPESLSPMLLGTWDEPATIDPAGFWREELVEWILSDIPMLHALRSRRSRSIASAMPSIKALREALDRYERDELELRLEGVLSLERLNFILEHPLAYVHRSPRERAVLEAIAGEVHSARPQSLDSLMEKALPRLQPSDERSLAQASEAWNWSDDVERKLELVGRVLAMRPDFEVGTLSIPSTWAALFDDYYDTLQPLAATGN